VKPRATRLMPYDNPAKPGGTIARSYSPIYSWGEAGFPQEKQNAMNLIFQDPNYMADTNGAGNTWQRAKDLTVFKVSVFTKLMMLGMTKFSTLDPFGMVKNSFLLLYKLFVNKFLFLLREWKWKVVNLVGMMP
jgi:hypothetical protein